MMYIRRKIKVFLAGLCFFMLLLACGCGIEPKESNTPETDVKGAQMTVHFVDVGQADCILIKTPGGKAMVIDAGNNADADTVVNYLKNQGISKIDFLIGTHPHEDHIGGMDKVIEYFAVGKFYMPKVTSTTQTYKDVINAAKSKNLTIGSAKEGIDINLDDGIAAKMLSPLSDKYDELNDYSPVIKLVYGNISFLFAGDAGEISENEMLKKGEDLSSTVLKVGHHGSSTSTTQDFLDAVNPKYAVISVGSGNDYGHPSQATLNRLNKKGIKVYRTDESGTIIASTDGENLSFNK